MEDIEHAAGLEIQGPGITTMSRPTPKATSLTNVTTSNAYRLRKRRPHRKTQESRVTAEPKVQVRRGIYLNIFRGKIQDLGFWPRLKRDPYLLGRLEYGIFPRY